MPEALDGLLWAGDVRIQGRETREHREMRGFLLSQQLVDHASIVAPIVL